MLIDELTSTRMKGRVNRSIVCPVAGLGGGRIANNKQQVTTSLQRHSVVFLSRTGSIKMRSVASVLRRNLTEGGG